MDTLIEAGAQGHGTPMVSSHIPASWAFDESLARPAYDPEAARQMLENAGWKATGRDGSRTCLGCATANEGTGLYLEMMYPGGSEALANVIVQQLRRVGIQVDAYSLDFGSLVSSLESQTFSLALLSWEDTFPVNPQQFAFVQAGDAFAEGDNYGSYYNADVERLMEAARTLPGCDPAARADLYAQVQTILQQDPPYAWLYVDHDLAAARGSVLNFDPLPNAPLWNMDRWQVRLP